MCACHDEIIIELTFLRNWLMVGLMRVYEKGLLAAQFTFAFQLFKSQIDMYKIIASNALLCKGTNTITNPELLYKNICRLQANSFSIVFKCKKKISYAIRFFLTFKINTCDTGANTKLSIILIVILLFLPKTHGRINTEWLLNFTFFRCFSNLL